MPMCSTDLCWCPAVKLQVLAPRYSPLWQQGTFHPSTRLSRAYARRTQSISPSLKRMKFTETFSNSTANSILSSAVPELERHSETYCPLSYGSRAEPSSLQ